MNAAIQVRVSTDPQAEKGHFIENQIAACRRYACELGTLSIEDERVDNTLGNGSRPKINVRLKLK